MASKADKYVEDILATMAKGIVDRAKIMAIFVNKWQVSQRTFDRVWKKAQEKYSMLQKKAESKLVDKIVEDKTENLSNGLKSKSERLMNLQIQADDIQRMLDSNITPDIVKSPKQLEWTEIERKLTYIERAQLMKALRELQAEISKIEGDYAATKMDHTTKGEQIKTLQVEIVNGNKDK